jgi:hypothetical protein
MTQEQRDAAIKMFKEYEQLLAENFAMQAVLQVIEKHGGFKDYKGPGQHSTWKEEVAYLMRSVIRENLRSQVAPIIQRIEAAFQDAELSRLLAKYPQKGPIN